MLSNHYKRIMAGVLLIFVLFLEVIIFKQKQYLLFSVIFALISCIPFYYHYENKKMNLSEIIIIAIMIVLTVLSRLAFAPLPFIKPIMPMIIITGALFNKESGFMVGSLSALISNMFFGQGPWTIYQMLLFGLMGYGAGLLAKHKLMDNKIVRYGYTALSGILFSILIDLLTSIGTGFMLNKWFAMMISALPITLYYVVGNIFFMFLLYDLMKKKISRIKVKYNILN